MYIKSLTVRDFRNYESESITLCPFTNIFYGNNAQGKTNLLEAVYLFSHGRSHRAKSDAELIKFGKDMYTLSINFCDQNREHTALMRYNLQGKKQIKINNVPITKLSMLMSYLNVVMFSPEDLELVKGSPSRRRHFVDEAISQLYPKYLSNLINYNKALIQKNSHLRTLKLKGVENDAILTVWNEQLADYGAVVYEYRKEFIKKLSSLAKPIHKDISNEDFDMTYVPGIKLNDKKETRESFFEILQQNQKREIELTSAQVGIQRDDLKITINGNEARLFGSQGQQRTCVLTLKMAETEYIKNERGEFPVLLLDDIMSELDSRRRSYLWERINDKQVLLTCTDAEILEKNENTKLFLVEKGKIK